MPTAYSYYNTPPLLLVENRMAKTKNVNFKLLSLTIMPLLLALAGVVIVTQSQFRDLAKEAEDTYRQNILAHKKQEIKNYMAIANGAIKFLEQEPEQTELQYQQKLRFMLNNMRFGSDGYFFVYDYQGNSIILPGQEWREGGNWFEMQDSNGTKLIQNLITQAQDGGGFSNYLFNQPSKEGQEGKKLAYSEPFETKPWLIGTGDYIDNIDKQVMELNEAMSDKISRTLYVSLFIGAFAIMFVFSAGMVTRVSEKRLANKKLRELNERIFQTQEEESRRVSRELHDGVSQTIAAARFSLETAQLKLQMKADVTKDIDSAIELIRKIMLDIRAISHQLHPSILEDHGLSAALDELGHEFSKRTGISVEVERLPVSNILTPELTNTLYRIAQEALTNVERHAQATEVNMSLTLVRTWLRLRITDNGRGFEHGVKSSGTGIGLRNMRERLNFYQGKLKVASRPGKTQIVAYIPKSLLSYNDELGQNLGE